MQIKTMALGPLQTNCYMIYKYNEVLIIDPGEEAEKVIYFIEENQLTPQAILLTHAHFDHIGGVDDLRHHYGIDVYLHESEAEWLEEPTFNGSGAFPRTPVKTDRPDHLLTSGELAIGSFTCEVKHTPGHSPGSVSFIFHDEQKVFSGDVLFKQGVGRTDLYGGSTNELVQSIRGTIYTLPDSFVVYPGHGVPTTIGDEKQNNPYVPLDIKN